MVFLARCRCTRISAGQGVQTYVWRFLADGDHTLAPHARAHASNDATVKAAYLEWVLVVTEEKRIWNCLYGLFRSLFSVGNLAIAVAFLQ